MKKKIARYFGILLLCVGTIPFWYLGIGFGEWKTSLFVTNMIPGILWFAFIWVVSRYSNKTKRVIYCLGIPFFLLLIAFFIGMNIFGIEFDLAVLPVTKISRYAEVVEKIKKSGEDSNLISHIPLSIPRNATNASLYYQPHFLQCGLYFQIYYKLPASDLLNMQKKYQSMATNIIMPGEWKHKKEKLPPLALRDEKNELILSENLDKFQILFLQMSEAQTTNQIDDNPWNHGYTSGIAINMTHQEIIYWVEDW